MKEHGVNLLLEDKSGRNPYQLLYMRRGRPGTPSGLPEREIYLTENREDLIDELNKKRNESDTTEDRFRKQEMLKDACIKACDFSILYWEMMVSMQSAK